MASAVSRDVRTGIVWGVLLTAAVAAYAVWNGQRLAPPETPGVIGTLLLEKTQANARATADWAANTMLIDTKRLPVLSSGGTRVFDVYRRTPSLPPRLVGEAVKPQLAVLVLNLGYDLDTSEKLMQSLPADIGAAVSPFAPYAADMVAKSDEAGRELWLAMPSASVARDFDGGANMLEAHAPATANIAHLRSAMGAFKNYVGIALAPDSAVASSLDDMDPIAQELQQRGLGLARLSASPSLGVQQIAAKYKVPLAGSAIDVSDVPASDAVQARLDEALTSATTSGSALVVIDTPNDVVMGALTQWLDAHRDAFDMVPPSSLAAAPPSVPEPAPLGPPPSS